MIDSCLVIANFRGDFGFLSNFADSPISIDGAQGATVEHFFQAFKTSDVDDRKRVLSASTPGEAKRMGLKVDLVSNWEEIKRPIMKRLIHEKFKNPILRERLLATGDALLIEGNYHHDNIWGDCFCRKRERCFFTGKNWLGEILMNERESIRKDSASRLTRIGLTGTRDLNEEQQTFVQQALTHTIEVMKRRFDSQVCISGMALGSDQLFVDAAVSLETPFFSYVPFDDQAVKWDQEEQERWKKLREKAAWERVLGERYDVRLLHSRNDMILRDSDVLVVVNDPAKRSGGTWSTLKKALKMTKPIIMVNTVDHKVQKVDSHPLPS